MAGRRFEHAIPARPDGAGSTSDEYWSIGGPVALDVFVTDANGKSAPSYLLIDNSSISPLCPS